MAITTGGGSRSGHQSFRRHEPRQRRGGQIARAGIPVLLVLLIAACAALVFASFISHTTTSAASEGGSEPSPIEVIAEHGVGDGYPATEVPIGNVTDIAVDGAGNVYFVDAVHLRVRRIGPDGLIDTVFNGHRVAELTGDEASPCAVAVDERASAVYVADDVGNRVWVVRDGGPEVFAGTGAFGLHGDGGPAGEAEFRLPKDLAVGPDGTVYVADRGNHRVRAIGPEGTIWTAAGDLPAHADWDDAVEQPESLFLPDIVAVGLDESLYVIDRVGQQLRRLLPDGTAQVLARGGGLSSIAVTPGGGLLVGDASGLSTLREGSWSRVEHGVGLTVARALGTDIVAYAWRAHQILRLDHGAPPRPLAGNGTAGRFGDGGPADGASFSCYDIIGGLHDEIVFSDPLNGRVAAIRDGQIRTLAPIGGALGLGLDARGIVYVADQASHRVLSVDPDGNMEAVAGNGVDGFSGDGGPATAASLSFPSDVVVSARGEILISDSENRRVRRVDPDGVITTFATFAEPTGSLFLHPSGQVVVSLSGGRELVELEPIGAPAAVKLAGSAASSAARSRREALGFTPDGELLFVSEGQLYGAKGSDPAQALPLGSSSPLAGAVRMAVAANGDLVVCDARRRILRVRGTTLQDALTSAALR